MERIYVSRFSDPVFALEVRVAGQLADPDAPPTATLVYEPGPTVAAQLLDPQSDLSQVVVANPPPAWVRPATRDGVGLYSIDLAGSTDDPTLASLIWDYQINSQAKKSLTAIEIGDIAPDYDVLPPEWKNVVERAWIRFADLFDSPVGGPNLQVYAVNNFGRNRLAQLLDAAMQTINGNLAPFVSYQVGGTYPFDVWGGLLVNALYVEIIKHLIRSYIEQPEVVLATPASRMDRRDYMSRWQTMLNLEQADLSALLSRFRQASMGLGNVSVLVSGGIYGRMGDGYGASMGQAAARGYLAVSRGY